MRRNGGRRLNFLPRLEGGLSLLPSGMSGENPVAQTDAGSTAKLLTRRQNENHGGPRGPRACSGSLGAA
jgi:hypothetical protein